jgi:UDP-N-acetylmuramoylalanine--D-glutamate ligase
MQALAAAFTNLTPDHLDRYADLAAYGAAKLRMAQRMDAGDAIVVNAEDEFFRGAFAGAHGRGRRVLYYATRGEGAHAGRVDGRDLVLRLDGAHSPKSPNSEERYPLAELHTVGRHNQSTALAALLLMRGAGLATYDQARAGLAAFRALPHRMELVGERRGVRYYDDSKATNVDSVVAGVDGFPAPFVLIAGGRDKGGSYAPLVAALQHNSCRGVVLIGEAADLIARALTGAPVAHERAPSLEAAVARAAAIARAGEAVVLSPACSSYDMFKNYEHRGRAFRAAVEALPA